MAIRRACGDEEMKLYRYEASKVYDYLPDLRLKEYEVIKETPCGAWIRLLDGVYIKKFVNLKARKKYACLTIEDALESFIRRKKRQILILKHQLEMAESGLRQAVLIQEKEVKEEGEVI
jgi:hypothetical protein